MKCHNAEQLLLLQDSGELSDRKTVVLTAHLAGCQACRQFQQTLLDCQDNFHAAAEEPSPKAVQNVLRAARVNAPKKKTVRIFGLKPALAMAASVMIGLGLFFSTFSPDKVALDLLISETQLLETEDQIVSVMYSGLSEDDLAFNFLMTYDGNGQG